MPSTKGPADLASREGCFWGPRLKSSCIIMWQWWRWVKIPPVSFHKDLDPTMRPPHSWPNLLLKVPFLNTITLGIRGLGFPCMNSGSSTRPLWMWLYRSCRRRQRLLPFSWTRPAWGFPSVNRMWRKWHTSQGSIAWNTPACLPGLLPWEHTHGHHENWPCIYQLEGQGVCGEGGAVLAETVWHQSATCKSSSRTQMCERAWQVPCLTANLQGLQLNKWWLLQVTPFGGGLLHS